jgi:hypothetical protein
MKALSCSGRKRPIEGIGEYTVRKKEKGTATPQNQPEVLSLFQPTPLRSQYLFSSDSRRPQIHQPQSASIVPMDVQDKPSVSENLSAAFVNGATDASRPAQRNAQLPTDGLRNHESVHRKEWHDHAMQSQCTFFRQSSVQIQQPKRESENDSLRHRACSQY